MRLGTTRRPPPSDDLAAALEGAAAALGHRPAVTVLRPDRREEQGFASLAQWAAKGAHLLAFECELGPGDRVGLATPPGWPAVAVCYAAWWTGIRVAFPRPDGSWPPAVGARVVHERVPIGAGGDRLYLLGDELDGGVSAAHVGDPYVAAVQTFPDRPPPMAASPHAVAVEIDDRAWTHAQLLDEAARWGEDGPLGLDARHGPELWVAALAVRPLRTGERSVLLADGVGREAALAEGVAAWA